ncbi:RNA recognition motif domain-containing protein [Paraflavitalea speifideaquila]|uniref:RNA recognition motif domain-containing protein n=1 Tax=Paraflavitalea speifideaquila TaxID=3076558 RepID=UPI003CCCEDF4
MNIYVSNLSFNVQDEDLKEFFAPYGEVSSAKVINDRETGRSRGFGFVEMPDDAAAQKLLQNWTKLQLKVVLSGLPKPGLKKTTALVAVAAATKVAAAAVITTGITVGRIEYPYVLNSKPRVSGAFF